MRSRSGWQADGIIEWRGANDEWLMTNGEWRMKRVDVIFHHLTISLLHNFTISLFQTTLVHACYHR
jgi:hypothetical protein